MLVLKHFPVLYPKTSSSSCSTSSVDDIRNCQSKISSNNTSTSSSQRVTPFYDLRSKLKQTYSSSGKRSTSSSISSFLRQHAQPKSSTSENLPSCLSDIPISLRPSSGIEVFTFHSYPRSTHLIGNHESVSPLSVFNPTDLQYHKLEENSRPPTSDLHPFPLRLDNQMLNHPGQDLRYHSVPVSRINNSWQYSAKFILEN